MKKLLATFLAFLLLSIPAWGALEFDGNTGNVNVGDIAVLRPTSNFSLVCTLIPTTPDDYSCIVGFCLSGTSKGWLLDYDNAPSLHWQCGAGAGWKSVSYNYTSGVKIVVIGVLDGDVPRLYINNALIGSAAVVTPVYTGCQFDIGKYYNHGAGSRYKGIIWDLRFYDRVLSEAERATITYAQGNDKIVDGLVGWWRMDEKPSGVSAAGAGSVIDISGYSNSGTPVNNPVYRSSPTTIINPTMY
ncbi:MAG: LamG domain-containing protein [Nanoarchaeota archaeon]